MKELLNEEQFDPKKLFDKENYNTLTIAINNDIAHYKESDVDLIISLLDENLSREERDDKLFIVKKHKLQKLLLKAIKEAENKDDKAKLLSICWESALDFKNDFLFFIEESCNEDYMTAFEAFTVAINIEDINEQKVLTNAILIIDNSKTIHPQIAADLKTHILQHNE